MFETFQKGHIAQMKVELRAAEKGWIVAKPNIESRYDIILDDGNKLWRAQVKYAAQIENGSVQVDLRRNCRGNTKTRPYTSNEIDVVLVYVPSEDAIIWIDDKLFDNAKGLSFRIQEPLRDTGDSRYLKNYIW